MTVVSPVTVPHACAFLHTRVKTLSRKTDFMRVVATAFHAPRNLLSRSNPLAQPRDPLLTDSSLGSFGDREEPRGLDSMGLLLLFTLRVSLLSRGARAALVCGTGGCQVATLDLTYPYSSLFSHFSNVCLPHLTNPHSLLLS